MFAKVCSVMSCQINTETYQLMCRCPLEDAKRLKTLADRAGVTMSAYVAALIHGRVARTIASAEATAWAESRRERNMAARKAANERTERGDFRKKNASGKAVGDE